MPNFMRVIVFFDLPVASKTERRRATQFRNHLLNDGYYMIQFSVYGRLCGGFDAVEDTLNRLRGFSPDNGSIRCMTVTEKQYARMQLIAGPSKKEEKQIELVQMSFL